MAVYRHGSLWLLSPNPLLAGRNLALMLTSMMLATLIGDREVELRRPTRLGPDKPLPGTLNHYGLRFRLNA